jgi:hypothetical protein
MKTWAGGGAGFMARCLGQVDAKKLAQQSSVAIG